MAWTLPILKPEIGPLEAGTIATAVSLGLSVIYNLGFFWETEPSLVSLLTIQDYAVGAVVGILPILAPMIPFIVMPDVGLGQSSDPARTDASDEGFARRGVTFPLVQPTLALVRKHRLIAASLALTAMTLLFLGGAAWPGAMVTWWFLVYFAFSAAIFLIVVGLSGFDPIKLGSAILVWIFATAFLIGMGSYGAAAAKTRADRVLLADGQVLSGTIVRVSANYVFMLIDRNFTALPASKVERIQNGSEAIQNG